MEFPNQVRPCFASRELYELTDDFWPNERIKAFRDKFGLGILQAKKLILMIEMEGIV